MRNPMLLFVLLFSLLTALFVVILMRRFGRPKRVRAVVLDKEVYTKNGSRVLDGQASEKVDYVVKFQTDTQILNLSVDPFLYEGLRIGDRGILYYRGNTALRFIRAKE